MAAVVALLAAVVAVLTLFVIALLRSHAEILRRLAAAEQRTGSGTEAGTWPGDPSGRAMAPSERSLGGRAPELSGSTPGGDAVKMALAGGQSTLLAFLSSGCAACEPLWRGVGERAGLPAGTRVVVVAKGAEQESVSRLRELAPEGTEVLMSSQAWRDYDVPGSPHFVLVDGGSGHLAGRGSAGSWAQIADMVSRAHEDARAHGDARAADAPAADGAARRAGTGERALRAEHALAQAGIGPGHPSLYASSPGDTARGR